MYELKFVSCIVSKTQKLVPSLYFADERKKLDFLVGNGMILLPRYSVAVIAVSCDQTGS
jgi:hypothetical protein